MENKHLLVIEDEAEIRELIEIILKRQGFQVSSFSQVEEFQRKSEQEKVSYDLMILDWMLPGQNGYDFLKSLRKKTEWKSIPIVMVTAKAEPHEVVLGLEAGADDYLIKPFDAGVLLARVKALLRRVDPESASKTLLNWGALSIHLESYEAFYEGEKLPLTPTEYKLLVIMVQHPGKVFTREQLVQAVQGEGVNVIGRTVDTHVFSLRKKLGDFGDHIETARGIGYRFRDLESGS